MAFEARFCEILHQSVADRTLFIACPYDGDASWFENLVKIQSNQDCNLPSIGSESGGKIKALCIGNTVSTEESEDHSGGLNIKRKELNWCFQPVAES
jgi:hypothetical protein